MRGSLIIGFYRPVPRPVIALSSLAVAFGRSSAFTHAVTTRGRHDDVITGGRGQLDRPQAARSTIDAARRFIGPYIRT
jgi:hypothetical protein